MLETVRPFMPAIAGFLAFFGVLLAVIGAAAPSRRDPIAERLDMATMSGRLTLEQIEMQAPFMERFVRPLSKQMARVMARLTPSVAVESTQRQLMLAGLASRMQVTDFLGIRGFATVVGIALGAGLGLVSNQGTVGILLLVFLFGGFAYVAPALWLRGQISQRKGEIIRSLPDAIDLLTISVEAGLGFDQAMTRVVSKSNNALTREFARIIQEMRIGVARRDALRAMVERTGVEELSLFITAIIQAEQLGASIANVLRIQAVEMRVRRRQRAERLAHEAPIKMLFPMVFLIFPPIFIVVLGPAIPIVIHSFAPHFPL
jgi:tight adherence protein C